MSEARPPIPPHLLEFVVEQDYAQYTAIDQAVWRFVLLQLGTRLRDTAHEAYRDGLELTGISVERIPRIEEMDERLSRFGWGAVCVDGFIPPRAFQEFQAAGYLPIAAEMRTLSHLVYTPAPDIIHEAAGHAPILSDPAYAAYIRRSGEVGARAFRLPVDTRVYRAIHRLSVVKEDPAATGIEVAQAERDLERALQSGTETSEASRLARLYWWTAEYGLIGTPEEYRLYGAGLLSSLGESHSCHDPAVKKLPLDVHCLDVPYDITRPQPQLFVARDFGHMEDVLDRAEQQLAHVAGGRLALDRALASAELATLTFDRGLEVIGVLKEATRRKGELAVLRLSGPVAFAREGRIVEGLGPARQPAGHLVLLGGAGSASPSETAERALAGGAGSVELALASGVRIQGRAPRAYRGEQGTLVAVRFDGASIVDAEAGTIWDGPFTWLLAREFVTARAGSSAPDFHAPTPRSPVRVPRGRGLPGHEGELLSLYEQARAALERDSAEDVALEFERIELLLDRDFPEEWLLRWNLLESLLKARIDWRLAAKLRDQLESLELRLEHRQPIASGLHYLSSFGLESPPSW